MELQRLKGQKALVTGAASGIGRGVALALAQAGAAVVVNYIGDPKPAEEVVSEIRSTGGTALAIEADVSKEGEVRKMFQKAIQELGTLDILVNNAGIQRDAALLEMTLEQWNAVISVNLTGYFLCAREAAREFVRRGVVPSVSRAAVKIKRQVR